MHCVLFWTRLPKVISFGEHNSNFQGYNIKNGYQPHALRSAQENVCKVGHIRILPVGLERALNGG